VAGVQQGREEKCEPMPVRDRRGVAGGAPRTGTRPGREERLRPSSTIVEAMRSNLASLGQLAQLAGSRSWAPGTDRTSRSVGRPY